MVLLVVVVPTFLGAEFDVDGRDGATDGAAAVVFPPLEIPENGKA